MFKTNMSLDDYGVGGSTAICHCASSQDVLSIALAREFCQKMSH